MGHAGALGDLPGSLHRGAGVPEAGVPPRPGGPGAQGGGGPRPVALKGPRGGAAGVPRGP